MLREITDDPNIGSYGMLRVMSTLEFLQHHFAKMGHRELLSVTHNLFQRKKRPFPGSRARGSVRRASGFVQIPIALNILPFGFNERSRWQMPTSVAPALPQSLQSWK